LIEIRWLREKRREFSPRVRVTACFLVRCIQRSHAGDVLVASRVDGVVDSVQRVVVNSMA
jgi:hypothetical protein